MNIADIEKVANRKRINAEAENLLEKVSRETANIIKLRVGQDTAYWDLKQKLYQVENKHERLQQNMVEVQMQHKVDANKINEINSVLAIKIKVIEEKDIELDCKASTINQLMSELKNVTDAKTKLDNSIEKMKKDMEEKENYFTKKVEQLEMAAMETKSELSKQMSIILETRKEKSLKEVSGFEAPKEPSQRLAMEPDNMFNFFSDSDTDELMADERLSLAQLKEEKTKRPIFKTKRSDNKAKKLKSVE